jgi:hypothetical protein
MEQRLGSRLAARMTFPVEGFIPLAHPVEYDVLAE